MFSKRQVDSNKLPPTVSVLKEKVSRVHYISLQWKSSHINPSFLNPNDYCSCFKENTGVYEPVMTQLALTPISILHLAVCNCGTKCATNSYKCYKNGLNCS